MLQFTFSTLLCHQLCGLPSFSNSRAQPSCGTAGPAGRSPVPDHGTEATVTLTKSSLARNKPDNCEPPGSITGCTGCTPAEFDDRGLTSAGMKGRWHTRAGELG